MLRAKAGAQQILLRVWFPLPLASSKCPSCAHAYTNDFFGWKCVRWQPSTRIRVSGGAQKNETYINLQLKASAPFLGMYVVNTRRSSCFSWRHHIRAAGNLQTVQGSTPQQPASTLSEHRCRVALLSNLPSHPAAQALAVSKMYGPQWTHSFS